MFRTRLLLACAVIASVAQAAPVVIPVSEDASVNRANPDGNLNTLTTRGGLFVGLDETGSDYRFYLKFNLPASGIDQVNSASLVGTYTDDLGGPATSLLLFFIPADAWDETTVTENTAPSLFTEPVGVSHTAGINPPATVRFEVTDVVRRELEGDRVLSLAIATGDGRFGDMKFFACKEFDPAQAFRVEINSQPAAIPLPEPALTGGFLLIASLGAHYYARRHAHPILRR